MAKKIPFKQAWQNRLGEEVNLGEVDVFRPITHDNVEYLLNRYPFLEMINTMALFEGTEGPKFVTSKSNWIIHDYGDALASSPGELLYDGGDYQAFTRRFLKKEKDEEGGDEGGEGAPTLVNPEAGTIVKQMFDTAVDMVALAIKKNWAGIKLINGTSLMKWAAWAAAKNKNFTIEGFEPTDKDEEKRQRVIDALASSAPFEESMGFEIE